jgi:hypothetical protein
MNNSNIKNLLFIPSGEIINIEYTIFQQLNSYFIIDYSKKYKSFIMDDIYYDSVMILLKNWLK